MADPDVLTLASDLIRIDTTNPGDGTGRERPAAEYVAQRLAEVGIEPTLIESAPHRANVVARIAGTDPARDPILVHGHLDVVPAEAADWSVHPFSGEVRDGMLWGRGAVDMKGMDAMMLAVVRAWARSGRRPARDVVLAFTADEEGSAEHGSQWLVTKHPELFDGVVEGISESGGYTFHAAGGVRLYPVGAGERGTAWLKLTARGRAGHGSRINPDNAVAALAGAVHRLAEYEWPVRPTPTVRASIESIAAALGVPADLDAGTDPAELLERFGAAKVLVEAVLRNSANPTMLSAGYKVNVIPETATGYVDGRVVPGARDEFEATLAELIGPAVEWEYEHAETALSADPSSATFAAIAAALRAEDPGAHVVPICLAGGTDAKQFSRLGITGYGFAPLRLPPGLDYSALYHGVDERVPVDALEFGVRVLDRFLAT